MARTGLVLFIGFLILVFFPAAVLGDNLRYLVDFQSSNTRKNFDLIIIFATNDMKRDWEKDGMDDLVPGA